MKLGLLFFASFAIVLRDYWLPFVNELLDAFHIAKFAVDLAYRESYDVEYDADSFIRQKCAFGNRAVMMDNNDSAADLSSAYISLVQHLRQNSSHIRAELHNFFDSDSWDLKMPAWDDILESQAQINKEKQWRMLQLRIYGADTKIAEKFPVTMRLVGNLSFNVWFSSISTNQRIKPHYGYTNIMWRVLMAVDLEQSDTGHGHEEETGHGEDSRTWSSQRSSNYSQTRVWTNRHRTGDLPYVNTGLFVKNWRMTGDALLFDDTFFHGSFNSEKTKRRVVLWLDLPRNDCGIVANAVIWVILNHAISKVHLETREMTKKATEFYSLG